MVVFVDLPAEEARVSDVLDSILGLLLILPLLLKSGFELFLNNLRSDTNRRAFLRHIVGTRILLVCRERIALGSIQTLLGLLMLILTVR